MAPFTHEQQVEFLKICVRNANNGKVDFGGVAKDFGNLGFGHLTKGAAAKRWERLGGTKPPPPNAPSRTAMSNKVTKTSMINKKRKFADNSADGAGDDEEISSTPGAKTIKKEVKKETFKLEDDAAQYYDMQSSYDAGSLDEGMHRHMYVKEEFEGMQ